MQKKRIRKSTAAITLTLIGSAALSACGPREPPQARDIYSDKADCVRDWGDENRCEPAPGVARSGGIYYYGPRYVYLGKRPDGVHPPERPGSHAFALHVSRGGFGSHASVHGATG
ncbi:MAG TPA: hypothetical protein VEG25_12330 [Burkholderiales bacterium]|nr:hypothetical protein [Burkholderiales bacterium]